MKKPKDVAELASRLSTAATTPLVETLETAPPRQRKTSQNSKNVLLRVPGNLYERLDAEAIQRTKATGRGVSVQQVILDKLGEA